MTYPPVIQFETRALEAEAQARLASERRATRASKHTTDSWGPLREWLRFARPGARAARSASLLNVKPTDCEQ